MAKQINLEQLQAKFKAGNLPASALDVKRQNGQSDRESGRGLAIHLARKLWPMMHDAYGYKWSSQYGDSPSETWVGALQGVTGEQIAKALNACSEIFPEWPPGALQFRAICEGRDFRNLDKQGIDVTYQHRAIERADRERLEAKQAAERLRLEDQNYDERNREAGCSTLESLKGLLKKH